MIEKDFAEEFARNWIESWNSHDLDRILSHYSDQFEMSSPKIIQIAGEPSGTLRGKDAVGNYWAKALDLVPDLRFEVIALLIGVNSLTLTYKGAQGRMAAEVFRASLIAPSLASAPLFVKNTLSIAEWSTIFWANVRSPFVKYAGLALMSFPACSEMALTIAGWEWPRQLTAHPWTKSR